MVYSEEIRVEGVGPAGDEAAGCHEGAADDLDLLHPVELGLEHQLKIWGLNMRKFQKV